MFKWISLWSIQNGVPRNGVIMSKRKSIACSVVMHPNSRHVKDLVYLCISRSTECDYIVPANPLVCDDTLGCHYAFKDSKATVEQCGCKKAKMMALSRLREMMKRKE